MTQEEVIELARQVGISKLVTKDGVEMGLTSVAKLEAFAKLVAEQVKEALTEQEPVAWRNALERIADPRNTHFGNDARVVAKSALDTTPPASPKDEAPRAESEAPQCKPLTDAQSERLYRNIEPSRQQDAKSLAAFKRLLRVIEAAHDITGEQHG